MVHVRVVKESVQNLIRRAENAGIRKHCCLQSDIWLLFSYYMFICAEKNVFGSKCVQVISKILLEIMDKLMSLCSNRSYYIAYYSREDQLKQCLRKIRGRRKPFRVPNNLQMFPFSYVFPF